MKRKIQENFKEELCDRVNVIEAKGIVKSFNVGDTKCTVLNDISLNIKQGDFVSIMGSSGSGKSTLLYLLGGLDKPTSGTIKINGKDVGCMKDKEISILRRREMGFVFQFYNLVPNLSVKDNVMLPLILDGKKINKYEDNLKEILDIVGLYEKRNHTPRELSGGQQQRVAIARALISNPKVILADEPIGNLDSKTGDEIMKLFSKINKESGITIVQVTHSEDAAKYGNRVIRVRDGVVV